MKISGDKPPGSSLLFGVDHIQCFEGGFLLTNTYLIESPTGEHVMIDAPVDADRWLDDLGIQPAALLLTHQHFDHVMTAAAIAARGVPIYAWQAFDRSLTLEEVVRQWGMPFDVEAFHVDHSLENRASLEIHGLSFQLHHVPGHSPDSLVFHAPDHHAIFAGDTLFAGSTGRTDFPGGSFDQLCDGIRKKIYAMPPDHHVFPGHGPATTIGHEILNNPIVRPA